MKRTTKYIIFLVLFSPHFSFACEYLQSQIAKKTEACFKTELLEWNLWSKKNPQVAEIIAPPKERSSDAKLLYFRSVFSLGFNSSDLRLGENLNLRLAQVLDPGSKHQIIRVEPSQLKDNDSGDLLKAAAKFSVKTQLVQPVDVQNRINTAIDLLKVIKAVSENQAKVMYFDNHFFHVQLQQKDLQSFWLPIFYEIDPGLKGHRPTEALLQYMDNFSFLGLRGISLTLFFESQGRTSAVQYFVLSLKGRMFKYPGADGFFMGNETTSSQLIRDHFFGGYNKGLLGGLPTYFKEKVTNLESGLWNLKGLSKPTQK